LAEASPRVGEGLHLIGNSGALGETMWRYGSGKVRSVYESSWQDPSGRAYRSWVIENQIPSNPGDSGGPVINDRGELAGILHGSDPAHKGLDCAIDIREIRRFVVGRWSLVGGDWYCRLADGSVRVMRHY